MTDIKKQRQSTMAHRRTRVATAKSRKNMARPRKQKQSVITRFQQEPLKACSHQIQVLQTQQEQSKKQTQKKQQAHAAVRKIEIKAAKIQEQELFDHMSESEQMSFDMTQVNKKMRERAERRIQPQQPQQTPLTAKQIKEQEIQKAISATNRSLPQQKSSKQRSQRIGFGFRKLILATACAAAAVFAVIYFVGANTTDISMKVAAMQTGIDAHYPGYVPRGFSLTDIISENGKITLNFKNSLDGEAFSIIEEKVNWKASDLKKEFVEPTYNSYTVITEGEIDIYVNGSNAAWLKDDVFYRISTTSGSLTKKQIVTIAINL